MTYRIELAPRSRRDLKRIPHQFLLRIQDHIDRLAQDPRPHGVKKLAGEDGIYRIRVGEYRVLYQIRDEMLLILVLKIAPRGKAYTG